MRFLNENHELSRSGQPNVTELIKRYLKSGVMEDGLLVKTEEGSPQGGPLSPLLANIYLNKFDWEIGGRGVPVIRYADDIVVLAKSKRAAERLLESCRKYLEGKLKLKVNAEKSTVVSVLAIRNFKFLGFALGRGKKGYYIRAHAKSLKKAKQKLRELTSRSQGRNVRVVMDNVKVYIRGWLGYFGIASMKSLMEDWDGWLRRRFRMYIWKQWKKAKTRVENLMKLECRIGRPTETGTRAKDTGLLPEAVFSHKRLQTKDSHRPDTSVSSTDTSLCTQTLEPPCTVRYARWCERTVTQLMSDRLLDSYLFCRVNYTSALIKEESNS